MSSYTFREFLIKSPSFSFRDGLFYQSDFQKNNSFEKSYLNLRQKEGRVYNDNIVRMLPIFQGSAYLYSEWKIRKHSAHRLIKYLTKSNPGRILEVGCGNGWLINYLHQEIPSEYCGIDINEPELLQAARLSGDTSSLCFVYGNILSGAFDNLQVDVIILASVIQYFPDLNTLIKKLLIILSPKGEIHIIDSPFYNENEIEGAKKRSENYFSDSGIGIEEGYYHHHRLDSLKSFHYKIVYQPQNLQNKLKRLFKKDSPFPWIIIRFHHRLLNTDR